MSTVQPAMSAAAASPVVVPPAGAPAAAIPSDPRFPDWWTLADLQRHLGDIPAERIRLYPQPGTATLEDVVRLDAERGYTCELVDGVLVEKPMGYFESRIAIVLAHLIEKYLETNPIGATAGEQGTLQLQPKQVRMADVSFIRWDRFPGGVVPRDFAPEIAPDLAVEVLSPSNTPKEMNRKLREYFSSGTRLVWYIDPETETARMYRSPELFDEIDRSGKLLGRDVLPGFEVVLGEVFDRAARGMAPPQA